MAIIVTILYFINFPGNCLENRVIFIMVMVRKEDNGGFD